ncbi:hypothetical protein DRN93_01650 [archaeon]|nr:MAG: hypothetical protein DRN93_01650 [archaeon]
MIEEVTQQKRSGIGERLTELENAIESLDTAVAELSKRINAVVIPRPVKEDDVARNPSIPPIPEGSPINVSLRESTLKINRIRDAIVQILDDLDL